MSRRRTFPVLPFLLGSIGIHAALLVFLGLSPSFATRQEAPVDEEMPVQLVDFSDTATGETPETAKVAAREASKAHNPFARTRAERTQSTRNQAPPDMPPKQGPRPRQLAARVPEWAPQSPSVAPPAGERAVTDRLGRPEGRDGGGQPASRDTSAEDLRIRPEPISRPPFRQPGPDDASSALRSTGGEGGERPQEPLARVAAEPGTSSSPEAERQRAPSSLLSRSLPREPGSSPLWDRPGSGGGPLERQAVPRSPEGLVVDRDLSREGTHQRAREPEPQLAVDQRERRLEPRERGDSAESRFLRSADVPPGRARASGEPPSPSEERRTGLEGARRSEPEGRPSAREPAPPVSPADSAARATPRKLVEKESPTQRQAELQVASLPPAAESRPSLEIPLKGEGQGQEGQDSFGVLLASLSDAEIIGKYASLGESLEDTTDSDAEVVSLDSLPYRYVSYFEKVKRKIQGVWSYPADAARRGQTGISEVVFILRKDGHLEEVRLQRGSGYTLLDAEAVNAIREAAPFDRFPEDFPKRRLIVKGRFHYHMAAYVVR